MTRALLSLHVLIATLLLLSIFGFAVGLINLTSANGWSFTGGAIGGMALMGARWIAYEMGRYR